MANTRFVTYSGMTAGMIMSLVAASLKPSQLWRFKQARPKNCHADAVLHLLYSPSNQLLKASANEKASNNWETTMSPRRYIPNSSRAGEPNSQTSSVAKPTVRSRLQTSFVNLCSSHTLVLGLSSASESLRKLEQELNKLNLSMLLSEFMFSTVPTCSESSYVCFCCFVSWHRHDSGKRDKPDLHTEIQLRFGHCGGVLDCGTKIWEHVRHQAGEKPAPSIWVNKHKMISCWHDIQKPHVKLVYLIVNPCLIVIHQNKPCIHASMHPLSNKVMRMHECGWWTEWSKSTTRVRRTL